MTAGRKRLVLPLLLFLLVLFAACDKSPSDAPSRSADFETRSGSGTPLTIVAGSENKILEPLIEEYAKESGQKVQVDYLGSLDIMNLLSSEDIPYDAVWPASTLWINMGDTKHILKHTKTTAVTPVIFGIRKSLAHELGFVGRDDVKIAEITRAIRAGKLSFCMTSATQSNSGASAYLAFLTSMAQSPDKGLTPADLQSPALREEITALLAGVNRSSGSSNWLMDLFLMSRGYDAMVNYEQIIIQTNRELERQKEEPLYAVYPVDGLSLSDAPLAYVDKGDDHKEKTFLDFQNFILSDQGQDAIEKTGKRNAFGKISDRNRKYYPREWGISIDRTLSPIRFPANDTIQEALTLYQTSFKKPAYTVYVLDYSGSMAGEGNEEMIRALEEIWQPEKAKANFLLGTDRDVSVFLPFASSVGQPVTVEGGDLESLLNEARNTRVGGSTYLFEGAIKAIDLLSQVDNLDDYTPAVVLLTDGRANGTMDMEGFSLLYKDFGKDIPVFTITFGDAYDEEVKDLAERTRARVFNGRENLIDAFKKVKGYN
ncbi:substrate-binding and vWA domain-containing protein [Kallipyga gabonensis]|uniref:substrate-binding and vWA domain-containing protein n=1 Tax=Kallipyga gabonensis TaxID=1686287 RepID=UPI0006B4BE2F|nr:substrate-binding and VWA domain-containing protein [Kallipyga gabonensis]